MALSSDFSELVACPICSRQIPESDINLHLDLQCPGNGSTSTSTCLPKVKTEPSQSSLKSSPARDVIEISDTPPRPTGGEAGAGAGGSGGGSKTRPGNGSGSVASIFGPRKRVKMEAPEENNEPVKMETPSRSLGHNKSRPKSVGKEDTSERKPKLNPLVASQP